MVQKTGETDFLNFNYKLFTYIQIENLITLFNAVNFMQHFLLKRISI